MSLNAVIKRLASFANDPLLDLGAIKSMLTKAVSDMGPDDVITLIDLAYECEKGRVYEI